MTETVRVLVPEDEDLSAALMRSEEPLLIQLDIAARPDDGLADGEEPWRLPEPIAGGAARAAYNRVYDALRTVLPTISDARPTDRRMLDPTGYEYVPVHLVALARGDLEALEATLAACQQALVPGAGHSDLAELLDQLADAERTTRVELVAPLARLVAVLTMPGDDDTLDLTRRLETAGAGGDVVLDPDQAAAIERLSRRWNLLLTGGDPISQYKWTGRS